MSASLLPWLRRLYLPGYHRRVRRRSDHPLRHARRLLERAAERQGRHGLLCDVGSGTEPEVVRDLWRGSRLAVDLTPGAGIGVAADAHRLPLRDKSADVVLLMQVLEHVSAPAVVLAECARVLRPGGHLCLTAPQYWITHGHPDDYYRYTRAGLSRLCADVDLRVIEAWATGGAALVVFHAIELNVPQRVRLPFVDLTYAVFDRIDGWTTGHGNRDDARDAVGWAMLAVRE